MPNRVIYAGILDSDRIDSLTAEEERFFIRLLLVIDDYGCYDGRTSKLASACFPIRQVDLKELEAIITKLEEIKLIRRYYYESKIYLQVINFRQKPRRMIHKYPTYQQACEQLKDIDGHTPDIVRTITENKPPETRNQKPETRNQKPETRNQKPEEVLSSKQTDEKPEKKTGKTDSDESGVCVIQDRVPYTAIISAFNSVCTPVLPQVQKLTDKRKRQIGILFRELKTIKAITDYFSKVIKSEFLTGKVKDWRADFDWLINLNNAVKVMEGRYDSRASPRGSSYLDHLQECIQEGYYDQ